jgi:hypothetical protein
LPDVIRHRRDPTERYRSVFSKDASSVKDAVVVLKSPKLDGDKLTFDVQVIEGDLAGGDGPASVFIDIIGLPFSCCLPVLRVERPIAVQFMQALSNCGAIGRVSAGSDILDPDCHDIAATKFAVDRQVEHGNSFLDGLEQT